MNLTLENSTLPGRLVIMSHLLRCYRNSASVTYFKEIHDFLNGIRNCLFRFTAATFSSPSAEQPRRRLFDQAFSVYRSLIDRICFGYADSCEEMEDLRQDALLNLWESMDKYRGDCSMKSWVYRITLNTCVSTVRKRSHRPKTIALTGLYDILADDGSKDLLAELHEAISKLSPIDKAIIMLWLDEMSYEEISMIMGLSKSIVTIRLHRAKKRLKSIMNNPE